MGNELSISFIYQFCHLKVVKRERSMHLFAEQLLFTGIPLYLLAFGVILLVLGYLLHPLGAELALPVAALSIAASLGWFVVKGAWAGGAFLPTEVLTVLGIGIVAIVLAKVFSGH